MNKKVSKYVADRIARKKEDFLVQFYRSQGKGGQNVNKRDTACRIKDKITGLYVECQEYRYQLENKKTAFTRLANKLMDHYEKEEKEHILKSLNTEVVRFYREKDGQVLDKRLPGETFKYDPILEGKLDLILDKLIMADLNKG